MEYELDAGAGNGRRLGLIVLSTDETLEWEARGILARRDLNLLHTRIPARAEVTPEDLASMAPELTRSAALLPQGLSVLGYGCTSAAARRCCRRGCRCWAMAAPRPARSSAPGR